MASQNVLVLLLIVCFNLHLTHANQPNVIFILTDDQGYRDVGYHGAMFDTPVIDTLAADGVKLENYYVQPMCSPTRAQLLTGRYQIRYGMQHYALEEEQPACLSLDEVTLAQEMKEAGYSTHLVGKWHLGFYDEACLPNNRGFDSYLGILIWGGYHYFHSDMSYHYDFHRDFSPAKEYNGTYATYLYTDEAVDIIDNQDEDTPFFMFLSYQAPHAPVEAPDKYKDPLRSIFKDESRLGYAAMVTCIDESIGIVVDALKDKGIYDNTVIIFSNDNGGGTIAQQPGNNWPYRGGKGHMFEGGMRAIGFVHSPLLPNKGDEIDGLIHVSDWFPTIVEGIVGRTPSGTKPLDGFNQWGTIRGETSSPRTEILHNIDPLTVKSGGGRDWVLDMSPFDVSINAAIRVDDWKLITGDYGQTGWTAPPDSGIDSINGSEKTEQVVWLFNIKDDPLEMNDLSDEKRDKVESLLTKLQEYYLESVTPNFPPKQPERADPCLNGNDCVWGPWEPV